ncbi:olfactory receptor 5AS1-like [Mantella aurantiaca]
MDCSNQTSQDRFILLGLSEIPYLQVICTFVFLVMYLITISGNFLLVLAVRINPALQNPMYFFLSNLSIIDICFSSTIVPKLLVNTLSKDRSISLFGCAVQMFFSLALGATECILLAVMAFDRFAAICKPLHYNNIMNRKLCLCLATGSWMFCFINSAIHVVLTFELPYCRSHHISHYFCEIPPFLQISCRDTWLNEVLVYISAVIIVMCSFLLTVISYFNIISTVLKIRSSQGRQKAFSTCSSHLTVVVLYYGTIMFMYMKPPSAYSETDRTVSILYTVVTPMINPFIYSIRNKDVKGTVKRRFFPYPERHQLNAMEDINHTSPERFILLGLSDVPYLQAILFLVFFMMYIMTLSGNLFLIIVVRTNPKLQTPMYFFLSNLSVLDICFTSTVVPKILINTVVTDRSITLMGCAVQMYFHLALGSAECIILAVMAYDRFAAICRPLHYNTIMNKTLCAGLAVGSWSMGFMNAAIHVALTFQLPFCKSHHVNHFFCEMPPFFRLSCRDTQLNEIVTYIATGIIAMCSYLLTLVSYVHIISTILRIRSSQGRHKAFSTCASHLTVVVLYYGTIMCVYLRSRSTYFPDTNKTVSIFYSAVTPMLNPFIYSIRNKDIKNTIRTKQKREINI